MISGLPWSFRDEPAQNFDGIGEATGLSIGAGERIMGLHVFGCMFEELQQLVDRVLSLTVRDQVAYSVQQSIRIENKACTRLLGASADWLACPTLP